MSSDAALKDKQGEQTARQSPSDAELAASIRGGDHDAFTQLVERHGPRLFRLAWRVLTDRQEAEDVAQEVLLGFWQRPAWRFGGGARLDTWLYRVTLNRATDELRKRRRRGLQVDLSEFDCADSDPGPDQALEASRRSQALHRLLAELPPRQHQALLLTRLEDMSQQEAARVMGTSAKAVESLCGRGLRALRRKLAASAPSAAAFGEPRAREAVGAPAEGGAR